MRGAGAREPEPKGGRLPVSSWVLIIALVGFAAVALAMLVPRW